MFNKIELSIVIPMYNIENYIERCLNSFINLDIKKEILLINDGSSDNTLHIAKKYKEKYKNIKIIDILTNKGSAAARNVGIKESTGEYISFIDGDDVVDEYKYFQLIKQIIKNKLDVGLGNGKYIYSEKNEEYMDDFKKDSKKNINYFQVGTGYDFIENLYDKCDIEFRSEMVKNIYRKKFLIDNDIYFNENRLYEDIFFVFQCMLKAKRMKYYNLDFYKYFVRKDDNNIMSRSYNYRDILYTLNDIKEECEKIKNKKIRIILEKKILLYYLKIRIYRIYRYPLKYYKEIRYNKQILNYILGKSYISKEDKIEIKDKNQLFYKQRNSLRKKIFKLKNFIKLNFNIVY